MAEPLKNESYGHYNGKYDIANILQQKHGIKTIYVECPILSDGTLFTLFRPHPQKIKKYCINNLDDYNNYSDLYITRYHIEPLRSKTQHLKKFYNDINEQLTISFDKIKFLFPRERQLDKSIWVPTRDFCKEAGYGAVRYVDVAFIRNETIIEIYEVHESSHLTSEKIIQLQEKCSCAKIYEVEVCTLTLMNIHLTFEEKYDIILQEAKIIEVPVHH